MRDEVSEEWRRLRNRELYTLFLAIYYLGDRIEKKEIDVACGTYGKRTDAHKVLVEKPEGNTLEDLSVDGRIILK